MLNLPTSRRIFPLSAAHQLVSGMEDSGGTQPRPLPSKTLGGALRERVLRTSKHIVFAMEPCVLKALLEGNIASQYRSDAEVRNALDTLCARARRVTQSSIYVQTLVDKDGYSPTLAELFQVV